MSGKSGGKWVTGRGGVRLQRGGGGGRERKLRLTSAKELVFRSVAQLYDMNQKEIDKMKFLEYCHQEFV